MVARATSALGQEVGKVFESAVIEAAREEVEARNYSIRPARLRNGTGNVYQIDAVVFDADERPIVIIDPKYIRYTKHNRDKGSWLCTAHYNLRKTHRTIRKSLAVLAGRWSTPSKALIRSFGIEIVEVPFDRMANALRPYGVEFDWPETGGETVARQSLGTFLNLSQSDRDEIGAKMVSDVAEDLKNHVVQVLDTDISTIATRVSEVEILLKTDQGELVLSSFASVPEAMKALTDLIADSPDIRAFIQPEPPNGTE